MRVRPFLLTMVSLLPALCLCSAEEQSGTWLTRLIFQEHTSRKVHWVDVRVAKDKLEFTTPIPVEGFPALDPAKQTLVQMAESDGKVLVGVRDQENGAFQSGWVMIHTGVNYIDHGDHGHWSVKQAPRVIDQCLDQHQGNPAHVYLYDGVFYVANDSKNGYTRLDPRQWQLKKEQITKGNPLFHSGGGNHITLAVANNKVGYSGWIDGGGPKKGKIDVTRICETGQPTIAYSFHLPTGVIHGAIAHLDKVFFGPADGVCWLKVDPEAKLKASDLAIHHLSLGTSSDGKPMRTGAFGKAGKYVLCVTGKGTEASLALIDAKADKPAIQKLELGLKESGKPTSPHIVEGALGKYALVFHEYAPDSPHADQLSVIQLDPNGDGSFSDAMELTRLAVGRNALEGGHFGHHDAQAEASGRYVFITNPGTAMLSVLDLKTLKVIQDYKLPGKPTLLVARGGAEAGE